MFLHSFSMTKILSPFLLVSFLREALLIPLFVSFIYFIREVDEALRPGVYALIDVCSPDDLQHLHTVFGGK